MDAEVNFKSGVEEEVIRRDRLDENVEKLGAYIKEKLQALVKKYPSVLKEIRGFGFLIGIELTANIPAFAKSDKPVSTQFVNLLHEAGVMTRRMAIC